MASLKDLTEFQLSALAEIGSIGAGHAAIALSQLIGKKIMVAVTKVQVMDLAEFSKTIGGDEAAVVGIHLKVLGDARGAILLAFQKNSAMLLVDILINQKIGTAKVLEAMEQSALKESGSILSASYLNSISDLMKLSLIPSVPGIVINKARVVFESTFEKLDKGTKAVIGIETEFVEAAARIKGYFLFMPEEKALDIFLKALGV
jgi:chemotaxis protein CheC